MNASNLAHYIAIEGTGFLFHHNHGGRINWHDNLPDSTGVFNVRRTLFTTTDVSYMPLATTLKLPIIFATSCETARYCPYVPYELYLGKDGLEHGDVDRGDIDNWTAPNLNPSRTLIR